VRRLVQRVELQPAAGMRKLARRLDDPAGLTRAAAAAKSAGRADAAERLADAVLALARA